MHLKIRCDGKSEKFYKFFWEVKQGPWYHRQNDGNGCRAHAGQSKSACLSPRATAAGRWALDPIDHIRLAGRPGTSVAAGAGRQTGQRNNQQWWSKQRLVRIITFQTNEQTRHFLCRQNEWAPIIRRGPADPSVRPSAVPIRRRGPVQI